MRKKVTTWILALVLGCGLLSAAQGVALADGSLPKGVPAGEEETCPEFDVLALSDLEYGEDYCSLYQACGADVTIADVIEDENGFGYIQLEDGKLHLLGLDFLSMAMVYNMETSAEYPTKDDVYAAWWRLYITRWNYLLPEVPMYSNEYYDVYNAQIKGVQEYPTSPFWDAYQALIDWTSEKADNSIILSNNYEPEGLFRYPTWGKYSANVSDGQVGYLINGLETVSETRGGNYSWNDRAIRYHSEEINPDGSKTITMVLEKALMYSNGDPVLAKDYLVTLLALGSPVGEEASGAYKNLSYLVGHEDYYNYSGPGSAKGTKEFAGLRLIDDVTFSVTIEADCAGYYYDLTYAALTPYPAAMWLGEDVEILDDGDGVYLSDSFYEKNEAGEYTHASLMRNNLTDTSDESWATWPFSGPYMIQSYDAAVGTVTLGQNPYFAGDYSGKQPAIQKVIYRRVDNWSRLNELQSGNLDVISSFTDGYDISAALGVVEESNGAFVSTHYSRAGYGKLGFRADFGPVQFREVRAAIAYCMDRDGFAFSFTGGFGRALDGPYSEASWMYQAAVAQGMTLNSYAPSLQSAIQVLEEGGWIYDKDGNPYESGIRYRQIPVALADERIARYQSLDGEYTTTRVGDYYYMPLVLNWFGTDPNTFTDMLEVAFAANAWIEDAGMKVYASKGSFMPMLDEMYQQNVYGYYSGTPMYSVFNFASGFTSNVYDYSWNMTIDPDMYDSYTAYFIKDYADVYYLGTQDEGVYALDAGQNEVIVPESTNENVVLRIVREENNEECFDHFQGLEMDGVRLVRDRDYTAESGSVIITFKPAFLQTLAEGEHILKVLFDDGQVKLPVTVGESSEPPIPEDPEYGFYSMDDYEGVDGWFSSFEGLKALLADPQVMEDGKYQYTLPGGGGSWEEKDDFVMEEDITVSPTLRFLSNVIVPEGVTLTLDGSIQVPYYDLIVEGTLVFSDTDNWDGYNWDGATGSYIQYLVNNGSVIGNGTLTLAFSPGEDTSYTGTGTVSEGLTIEVFWWIDYLDIFVQRLEGFQGAPANVLVEAYCPAGLAGTLEDNLIIPANIKSMWALGDDGEVDAPVGIVIPEGIMMMVEGDWAITGSYMDPETYEDADSFMEVNGNLLVDGTLTVDGSLTGSGTVIAMGLDGSGTIDYTGENDLFVGVGSEISSEEELLDAIEAAKRNPFRENEAVGFLYASEEYLIIDQSVTLSGNDYLMAYGSLEIDPDGELIHNGYLLELSTTGDLIANGSYSGGGIVSLTLVGGETLADRITGFDLDRAEILSRQEYTNGMVALQLRLPATDNSTPEEGYIVELTDYTKGLATTTLEPGREYNGLTSFAVYCDAACVVAVVTEDGYEELSCEMLDGVPTFTVDMTEDTEIVIVLRGDTNLDGSVGTKDATFVRKIVAQVTGIENQLPELELSKLAGDSNADGSVGTKDATAIRKFVAQVAGFTLPWKEVKNPLAGRYTVKIWVSEAMAELTEAQIEQFNRTNTDGITINAVIEAVSEGDAAYEILFNQAESGDLFCFAQDQLTRLVMANALAPLSAAGQQFVADSNGEGAVAAATTPDGTTWAYPLTSDNGYFMYYDKSVIPEADINNLERIIADCQAAGKNFCMEVESSAWYLVSWFFATGCESEWFLNAEGAFVDCYDTFNSPAGMTAAKGMKKLLDFPGYINASQASSFETANAAVVVSGTWDYNTAKAILGDNLGVAELPSFTVDGQTYHLGSFSGCKLMGIKPQSDPKQAAVLNKLAQYLTGEACQLERYEALSWGPSNKHAQQSEDVQANPALAALLAQNRYSRPQGQIHGAWWEIGSTLGREIAQATTDDELHAALARYEEKIQRLFASTEEYWGVIGMYNANDGFFFSDYSDERSTWADDCPMHQEGNLWKTDAYTIPVGCEFKVRQNGSWENCYPTGDNFVVPETGVYVIVFNELTKEVYLENAN